MKTSHFHTDQDWQNETTTYWFSASSDFGETEYGVVETAGLFDVVDSEGCPLPQGEERRLVEKHCVVTQEMQNNL